MVLQTEIQVKRVDLGISFELQSVLQMRLVSIKTSLLLVQFGFMKMFLIY